jgi:hypothetical protein
MKRKKPKLTDSQISFDVSQFFDPDAPSGEPVLEQVVDPFTGSVHCPGMEVTKDGKIIKRDNPQV